MYEQLIQKSKEIRRSILIMLEHAGSGHTGGSLSAADIVTALYFDVMRNIVPNAQGPHDHFILSKGHAAPVQYAALAKKGFVPEKELMTLRQFHSRLQGHPDSKKCPGIEICTGSLGQGVSRFVRALSDRESRLRPDLRWLSGPARKTNGSMFW